jgi:two-component system sensor histidine kinase YesM
VIYKERNSEDINKSGARISGLRGVFQRFSHIMTNYLDNLKLRDKMIIMCVICVLIPIVLTNTVFFVMTDKTERARQQIERQNALASVEYTLDNMVSYMTSAATNIYTTKDLYAFLDEEYESNFDYLLAYDDNSAFLRKVTFGNYTYISSLQIYCDNDTLIDGGGVYHLDTEREMDWYKRFKDSKQRMAMFPSLVSKSASDRREVSVFCRMDYNSNNKRERILKLNLNYYYFVLMLNQQIYEADVYICDDERILFSNTDPNKGTQAFISLDEVDFSDAKYSSDYKVFGDTWKIYLYPHDEGQINAMQVIAKNWPVFTGLIIINMLLPGLAIYLISRSITHRIIVLGKHIQMVKDEKYAQMEGASSQDEIGALIDNYNRMAAQIENMTEVVYKEKIKRQEYELAKQRSELLALHSQINPHFMFNALESIRMRSLLKHETETAEVIEFLAILMRKSTDWCDDCVTLSDEVSFAEAYLKLQKYRFGERLSYKMNISEDCLDMYLPKLSLLTFVENACVHGVEGVGYNCSVIISAEKENGYLNIYIEDTGAGMDETKQKEVLRDMREGDIESLRGKRSVGILNACIRLRKFFGENIIFEIDSEPKAGTCISIRIPLETMERIKGGSVSV